MRAIEYAVMSGLLACVVGCRPSSPADTGENALSHAYLPGRTLLLSDELTMFETHMRESKKIEISTTVGFDLELTVSKDGADAVNDIRATVARIWMKASVPDQSYYIDTAKPETMKDPSAKSMPKLVGAVYHTTVDANGKIAKFTAIKAPDGKLDSANEMAPVFRGIAKKVFLCVPDDKIGIGRTWKLHREYMCFPLSISLGRITEDIECKLVKISNKDNNAPTIHVSISGTTAPSDRHPRMDITGSIVYRKKSKDLVAYKTQMSIVGKGQEILITNKVVLTEKTGKKRHTEKK